MKKATKREESVLYREYTVTRDGIDAEKRTVEMSFSSETPVPRWGAHEVLDHDEDSVRLDRLRTNGPFLMDHNWSDQVGIVEEVTIGADRVGRAVVRFSKSARAQEILEDFIDGIRKSISVGYRVYKALLTEENEDEPDVYRIVDWEPLEISCVSVPADISVGVGRSDERTNEFTVIQEVRKMEDDQNVVTAPDQTEINEKRAAIESAVNKERQRERSRIRSIRNVASTYPGHDALVDEAIRSGQSADDFIEKVTEAELDKRANDTPDTHLDLSEKDTERYSICRALLAQQTGDWNDAGFELECSREITERIDSEPRGVYVPYDVQSRVVTTTGPGAGVVGTDLMSGSFIDNLRDRSLLISLGARTLTGLRGYVDIPRKTGSATHYWVGEDVDGTLSDVSTGTLSMSPKTVAGAVAISRRSLKQSTPDMDDLVMSDLAEGSALAVDIAGLAGAIGGDNPTGVWNTTGVLTNPIATAGQPTWEEIVNFETLCAAANSLAGSAHLVTTPGVRGYMKTAKKDAGSGIFLVENNEANGYPVSVKTDAGFPVNGMLFGNFSQLILAMWGVLDAVLDKSTKAASGGLVIRTFQDLDFGVRQPTAFVKNA